MVAIKKKDARQKDKREPAPSKDRLSAVELVLASRGRDYGDRVPGGVVMIRPPLFSEVKYFAQFNADNYQRSITELIRRLLVDVSIDPFDLTSGDRSHFHLWVRGQVDPFYRLSVICPICSHADEGYEFEIKDIPIKEIEAEYSAPFDIELPDSGSKVVLRLETGRDAVRTTELVERGVDDFDARHAVAIVSVDGKPMDPDKALKWLTSRNVSPQDGLMIAEFVKWSEHGPDYKNCSMTCRKCGKTSSMALPFRLDFFLPSVSAARSFGDAVHRRSVQQGGGSVPGDAGDRPDGDRGVPVRAGQDT